MDGLADLNGPMTSLSSPLVLRHGRTLPNRLVLSPLTNKQSLPDGSLSEMELTWLLARARGGFGLTVTAAAFVNPAGRAWAGQLGVCSDDHLPGLERLAQGVLAAGGASAVQLHHGGLRADALASGLPLVAPWADAAVGARALSSAEVGQVVEDFADAAVRVERAGLDGVELHGAHGYLLCQFLDAEHNTREDGYGGDYAGRTRIIHDVIDAIRARTGEDFQVGLRVSPERFGVDPAEMVQLTADMLARGDLDYIDLSLWDVMKLPAGAKDGPLLIDHFLGLPRHGTALGVAGRIATAADAQAVLSKGADLAFVGKAAIADHDFAHHALTDVDYQAPAFPVTKDHLRAQFLGEPFVEYFSTNWPKLVKHGA